VKTRQQTKVGDLDVEIGRKKKILSLEVYTS
jgi:hypothetical protein